MFGILHFDLILAPKKIWLNEFYLGNNYWLDRMVLRSDAEEVQQSFVFKKIIEPYRETIKSYEKELVPSKYNTVDRVATINLFPADTPRSLILPASPNPEGVIRWLEEGSTSHIVIKRLSPNAWIKILEKKTLTKKFIEEIKGPVILQDFIESKMLSHDNGKTKNVARLAADVICFCKDDKLTLTHLPSLFIASPTPFESIAKEAVCPSLRKKADIIPLQDQNSISSVTAAVESFADIIWKQIRQRDEQKVTATSLVKNFFADREEIMQFKTAKEKHIYPVEKREPSEQIFQRLEWLKNNNKKDKKAWLSKNKLKKELPVIPPKIA